MKNIEVPIHHRNLSVLPLPGESQAPPPNKTRIELLRLAADRKIYGHFTASILDLAQVPRGEPPPENPPLPPEVAYWLSAVFGEAVYIQSLVPQSLGSGWPDNPTPELA